MCDVRIFIEKNAVNPKRPLKKITKTGIKGVKLFTILLGIEDKTLVKPVSLSKQDQL